MRKDGALCRLGMLARFSPDSARTKKPIARMAVTQKINRAAFDIFIRVLVFLRASNPDLFNEAQLTLCGSAPAYCADACEEGKQNFLPTKKRSI
jgi:hypothetical protein